MYPIMGEDRTPPEQGQDPPGRRLTVSGAVQELGISAEAVRSRIKRGTLESVKEGSTVYVLLPYRPGDDQTTTERDRAYDQAPPEHERVGAQGDLVESLIDQVAYMREQLAEEREARRRADTIIAQLSQANAALASRVPEIEAPQEPPEVRESPETVSEGPGKGDDVRLGGPEPHHPVERPSWWRRFFGFE
jgi:hypothetical protein